MKKRLFYRLWTLLLLLSLLIPGAKASNLAVERQIFSFFTKEMGMSAAAACGILANIEAESNFRPTCWGDNGTSFGLCQWHNSRFQDLKSFCLLHGYDYTSVEGQLNFLVYELKTKYPNTYNSLLRIPNTSQGAYDAAWVWCINYERPAGMETSAARRGRTAQMKYWLRYGDSSSDSNLFGNSYTGNLFGNQQENYTFYWEENNTSSPMIPGTTIQIPAAPAPDNSPSLPQQGEQSEKPSAESFMDRFHYVPHHIPVQAPSAEPAALWGCLFISMGPAKKKDFSLAPQWEECPELEPEDVEMPEELMDLPLEEEAGANL